MNETLGKIDGDALAAEFERYLRRRGRLQDVFTGCGALHVPFKRSGFGQYSRSTSANGPLGAGSQLDSLSDPGDSFWMRNV